MTGNSAPAEQPQQPARRQQPTMQAQRPAPMPQAEAEPEDDRIEIPAFLRRQAN
jgi:cell division protein FtsZ